MWDVGSRSLSRSYERTYRNPSTKIALLILKILESSEAKALCNTGNYFECASIIKIGQLIFLHEEKLITERYSPNLLHTFTQYIIFLARPARRTQELKIIHTIRANKNRSTLFSNVTHHDNAVRVQESL